jgi:uncharacterized membrane protein
VLGHGTIATRFWAFAVGCAAVYAIYMVGSTMFNNRQVGLVAALLLAFSSFHLYYSQEARFYSLTVLVALLNLYFFNRALERRRRRDWLLFGIVVALAFYTHYFLALLLPIEGAFLVAYWFWRWASTRFRREVFREGLREVGLCAGAMLGGLLLFTPWIAFASAAQFRLASGSWSVLPRLNYALVRETIIDLMAVPPSIAHPRLVAFSLVGLGALGLLFTLRARRPQVLIVAAAIVLAVPAAWAADQFGHYFWVERQVIFILPLLYLLAAAGIAPILSRLDPFRAEPTEARDRTTRAAVRLAAVGAVLSLAALWSVFNWSGIEKLYWDRNSKEDWRGAAALMASTGCPGAHYYSNVPVHFQYGVGYYQPQLQARFIHEVSGRFEPSLTAAVSAQKLDDRDWIALLAFAAGAEAAPMVHATLTQQGWSYREFPDPRLRVYYRPPTCGRGA